MVRVAVLAVVLVLLAGCPGPAKVAKSTSQPKLVVLIVIDQLPTWAVERDRALYKGGLARLLKDGAYVRAAELPYANTFTAPGHATIATGAVPSVHGVVGNQWWRRVEGRERPAEYDPASSVLSVGPSDKALTTDLGASGIALRVDGVADILRRATLDRAHSVAIALKARAAVLMAGRQPELAIWYEPAAGGMTTSRAYAKEVPRWLADVATAHPVSSYVGSTWEPLDAGVLARGTGIADDAPGEGSLHGTGTTFPHHIGDTEELVHTPAGDELVMNAVLAALDGMQLGADDVPDLLAISFNAHDYAGHNWGPDSWEVLDLTLRLDLALGKLFATLDRRLGKDGWAVVLTSDHGATPVVERARVAGATRITPMEIANAAEAVLARRLGTGPWVAKVTSDEVYMTDRWTSAPSEKRADALTAAAHAIAQMPGVAASGRVDQIEGGCERRTDLDQLICRSIVPREAGELYVVPKAGSLITDYTTGTHHDAPFDENRLVPILVMAPGVAPQVVASGSLLQVAPTVAALLGVPPPEAATEKPLFGIAARVPAR